MRLVSCDRAGSSVRVARPRAFPQRSRRRPCPGTSRTFLQKRGRTMSTTDVIQELNRIKAAEAHVAPHINGPLMASDCADQVYAQALRQLGYTGTVYRGAGKQMFDLARRQPR